MSDAAVLASPVTPSTLARPRVGFLGVGWIGRHRMQAVMESGLIEAAGIADTSAEMLQQARELAPQAVTAPDLDALLDLGLDGLVIATPSALHADQCIRALERGVAVFCQKPLGRTAAEVQNVVAAARAADRLLSVDMSYRFTEAVRSVENLVRSGALGRIHAVDLVFHNAYGPDKPWFYDPAQSGGGCVMDLGVHLVDLALWLLDFPAVAVVTSHLLKEGFPLRGGGAEDFAVAQLVLADGAVIRLACSWRLPAGQDAVISASLYGSQGGAEFRNIKGSFYDFVAERFSGTQRQRLASPPDAWGGRAAVHWAQRLAHGMRFDSDNEQLTKVSAVLDRIYGRG